MGIGSWYNQTKNHSEPRSENKIGGQMKMLEGERRQTLGGVSELGSLAAF